MIKAHLKYSWNKKIISGRSTERLFKVIKNSFKLIIKSSYNIIILIKVTIKIILKI